MVEVEEVRKRRASTQGRKYRDRAWHKDRGVDEPVRATWELLRFVGRFAMADEEDERREEEKEELNAKRSDLRDEVYEKRQSAASELEEVKDGRWRVVVDGDVHHEEGEQTIQEEWPADVGPQA